MWSSAGTHRSVARPPAAGTREAHATDGWGTPPAHNLDPNGVFNSLSSSRKVRGDTARATGLAHREYPQGDALER
jgi:hypothetical protein